MVQVCLPLTDFGRFETRCSQEEKGRISEQRGLGGNENCHVAGRLDQVGARPGKAFKVWRLEWELKTFRPVSSHSS